MNNVYSTDCVRDLYLPVSVTTIRHFIKWPSVCNYPCHGHALLRIICMSVFFATRSKTTKECLSFLMVCWPGGNSYMFITPRAVAGMCFASDFSPAFLKIWSSDQHNLKERPFVLTTYVH